ncbi:MAG: nickel-dependent lactate racemase [Spirochaetes bacterium]|nr:nickel-dependent lactate racemase [Spirochaetota bacterium]
MKVSLPYGAASIDIEVPEGSVIIEPAFVPGLADEKASALRSFRNPAGTRTLRDVVSRDDRVVIVVSDITRPLPSGKIVPWILEELTHVPRGNFTVLIGCGTHRACTDSEMSSLLGDEIVRTVRCVNHDAFDSTGLVSVGTLGDGTAVLLNRIYAEADIRITTGFIEPHFFAGFSGGPKAVMPGIAGIRTIMRFHDASMIGHGGASWGALEGNPVYEMARDAALMMRPDFSVNVTLNRNHEITGFYCGDVVASHREGAVAAASCSMFRCAEPFDIVITSNGGYPLDQNLYQTVKGICAAASIVKERGVIICVSRCSDGVPDHGDFIKILAMKQSPRELLDLIREPGFSRMDQWQVQKLAASLVRADVYLYSDLPGETMRRAHCVPCRDIGETLSFYLKKNPGARIAVLREGPMIVPYCNQINGGVV